MQVLALIVAPTRELALQIATVAKPFLASVPGCSVTTAIGGTDVSEDIDEVKKGAACIIGTPGRVDDIFKRMPGLSFKQFEVLVLDEADRLLEMGFQRQLDSIIARLPRQRRTGLFSATQTVCFPAGHTMQLLHCMRQCRGACTSCATVYTCL
jgi:ATP-dependent RNA helicase DDX55/SPB4